MDSSRQQLSVSPETTAVIASIWADVLGVEACDRQANFFDIGGSSVKMIKIHSELQRRLGLEVSIVELFAHPTIATLVERLAVLQQSTGPATVPLAGAPRPLGRMFRPMKPKS